MEHGKVFCVIALTLIGAGSSARAQVHERSATITGPGGRTVEREVRRERSPGELSRSRSITGPGGRSLTRELHVERGPGPRYGPPPGPPISYGRNVHVQRHNTIVERDIYVNRTPNIGIAAPFFSFFLGSVAPPPPPVYVAPPPPPVIVQREVIVERTAPPPPPVVVEREVIVQQPPPPPVVQREVIVQQSRPPFDPYSDALGRLSSRHDNSRRDGVLTLGRLGDPRAVPALIHVLQNDEEDDVRAAAAQALGALGDPRASSALEYSALSDDDGDVRRTASHAYARLPRAESYPSYPAPEVPQSPPPPPGNYRDDPYGSQPPLAPPSELPHPTGFQPLRRYGG